MTATLAGRVALVTGGSRGIGRAIALALAAAGMAVAVTARTRAPLDAARDALRAAGAPEAWAEIMDTGRPAEIDAGLQRLRAQAGDRVDVLVNNAGVAESAPLARTSLAQWERHLAVNATGPFLLTQAVLPGMLEGGWGRIVNVASIVGLEAAPYIAAYAASKHALVGLTRAVAAETRGRGVTVNAVCPGYVATDLTWESARRIRDRTGKTYDEAVAALAALNPSGKLVEAAAVAAAALELVHDAERTGDTVILA
jgi:NAD(P)-dependent dehydrogenase (short-subunit alcohol dehydrogenase family)